MHTTDRMASGFYTVERLGARQSVTNDGFLLCEGVPIARIGELLYAAGEVPVEPGRDGIIRIERTPEEVFRPETLASFEGKPVTMDHPAEFVTPDTWRQLAVGITQNVRRGEGLDAEYVVADLLITDRAAIEAVRFDAKAPDKRPLREVSCGYDADYEQFEPGRGVQRNIIGNHVALVERGRCGPRCAIGDKESDMSKKKSTWDRIRAAFKSKDEAALEEALEDAETADADGDDDDDKGKDDDKSAKTGDSAALAAIKRTLDSMNKRFTDMEAELKEIKEKQDEDDGKTGDTVLEAEEAEHNTEAKGETYTGDMATVRSGAEILAPGIKLPTFDSKAVKTADAVCACQRKALETAYATDAGRAAIDPFLAGRAPEFGTMDASSVSTIFNGAAALRRHQNNTSGVRSGISTRDFGRPSTVSSINEQNRKFWDARTGNK
ncbi:DUF2213 domain-containing protein [Achromobacter piechaudii]|uniref:DUF2213 domain-containing protein n=1 Tax=Achromobacter piechaudii TaxID=72556 RepID=UPI0014696248|nr:DUF2213 domain-containing protein [Achromobacter piechaudii]CAB3952724.1 hypothetical protein LMG6103_03537 [Achromobacter piechaudii]